MAQAVNDYTPWLIRHDGIWGDSSWFTFVGSSLPRIIPSNAFCMTRNLTLNLLSSIGPS